MKEATVERGLPNGSGGRRQGWHLLVLTRGDEVLVIGDERKIAAALGVGAAPVSVHPSETG